MMSPARAVKPGYVVTYPNREKPSSRATRTAVAVVLAVSALLMLFVTVGGWSKLAGLEPLNIIWCLVYLVMAFYVMRWARELLPIAVGLAALMFVFTLIAETAAAGISWNDRNGPGYAPVHALFGGGGLSPSTLNALTVVIAITQALLIAAAVYGFSQAWNIEFEVPAADAGAAVTA
jgi:lysylphosphatidylglycerol synthetase-like protein (DUF2156 family)